MLSSIWGTSPQAHSQHDMDLLPSSEAQAARDVDYNGADVKFTAADPATSRSRDKIRCLDGLRGIACLLVFNYHFLWPWTPSIMLGYGALPPGAPEPYTAWSSLPVLCLLNRGRPMVAIFFAISGYVLCRHILRAIHERRLEAAYQSLTSSVFRRVFRLYIPPTISMFAVAMLAQVGVFRSEAAIFTGPDSVHINGTVTAAHLGGPCLNGTIAADGAAAIAESLGLQSTEYLGNVAGWTSGFCLNMTSQLSSPAGIYDVAHGPGVLLSNDTAALKLIAPHVAHTKRGDDVHLSSHHGAAEVETSTDAVVYKVTDLMWVQLGGSWEEHPFIHDNITYALQNFTRVYVEWANPFNFGHHHTRYDPHTFTIPMELRGSMFIYIFLLGTAALKSKWRLRMGAFLSAYSLLIGRWDMATFMGAMMLSEMDVRSSSDSSLGLGDPSSPPSDSHAEKGRLAGIRQSTRGATALRWVILFAALYLLSYPDAGAEYTPGFVFLSSLVPRYYGPLSGWMFYQSMGALLLLPCVLRSRLISGLLERQAAQYLGRISFSFYLMHGPVLHSLGFWIMPRLFEKFGRTGGFVVGWVTLLGVTLVLSGWWYRRVDVWSMTFGKRIERLMLN